MPMVFEKIIYSRVQVWAVICWKYLFYCRFTISKEAVRPLSVSKNLVIPTKRSAWRDHRSNKSVGKNHYMSAFGPEMRRSLDDPRDDKMVGFGT